MTEREEFEAQVRADTMDRVAKVEHWTSAEWRKRAGVDVGVEALCGLATMKYVDSAVAASLALDTVVLAELLARTLDKLAATETALAELAPQMDLRK